jgi:manganese transport protein
MLSMAAAVFGTRGLVGVGADLVQVSGGLDHYIGDHSGLVFGIALLASGVSSSSVGTLSGQVVMQGFIRRQVPVFLRRAITMVPAMVLIASHFDPSRALVLSQVALSFGIPFAMIPLVMFKVALSFGIPFAMIPLVMFTRNRQVMGNLVNSRATNLAAYAVAAMIIGLNVFLIYQTFSHTA